MSLDLSHKSNAPQPGPASHNSVKPSRDWKKSGGNSGGDRTGDLPQETCPYPHVKSQLGYTKVGDSPVRGNQGYRGIDADKYDGQP